jgi:hypothetical protein
MLTSGGEEDRGKDDRVRQWWQKDATLASTGGGEEDRDNNNNDHHARRWRWEDAMSTLTLTLSGGGDNV